MGVMTKLGLAALAVAVLSVAGTKADAKLLSAGDRQIYQQTFDLIDKESWSKARELAARAKDPLPEKFVQWLDLTRPGPGRSFDEITAFMRENPDWPGQSQLQAQGERAMTDGYGPDAVIAWFAKREPRTAEGAMRLGFALLRNGKTQAGIDVLRKGWVAFPMLRPVEDQYLASFGANLRPEDHVARLDRLLWERELDAARRQMERVDPAHRKLADARLKLIESAPGVDAAVKRVPSELQNDPGLLYDRARWRRQRDDNVGAAALLDPPPATTPFPDKMWREYEYQARRALERGEPALAYRLAEAHGAVDGTVFADGEWLAGWIALRFLNDPQRAFAHFTRMYAGVGSPISLGRGAYWAGRAAEAMGQQALATEWYGKAAANLASYYGQLGAQRLGADAGLRLDPLPTIDEATKASFAKNELVRLVRMMAEIGETDRMRSFIVRIAETLHSPAEFRMLAELGKEIGREDYAVAVAKVARTRGIELVEYLFPTTKVPDGGQPEHALVLAVIRQESAFDQKAVSSAGALGLMQLMPRTAKHVAGALGLAFNEKKLTGDPQYNIRLGRAYLAELIGKYGGSYVLAIASYNAGPSRAREWMTTYGDPRSPTVDAIDWVESIPFSETRNYVQRVLENLQVYRNRLGSSDGMVIALESDLSRPGAP